MITILQKLYSLPRNLRVGNKLPVLFLKRPLCTGDLLPTCKIFIERPEQATSYSRPQCLVDQIQVQKPIQDVATDQIHYHS